MFQLAVQSYVVFGCFTNGRHHILHQQRLWELINSGDVATRIHLSHFFPERALIIHHERDVNIAQAVLEKIVLLGFLCSISGGVNVECQMAPMGDRLWFIWL